MDELQASYRVTYLGDGGGAIAEIWCGQIKEAMQRIKNRTSISVLYVTIGSRPNELMVKDGADNPLAEIEIRFTLTGKVKVNV